jgi:peptidyl-prolyl cis-trans isomerase C/foldase protein PrsA
VHPRLSVLLLLTACTGGAGKLAPPEVVATVDGASISATEYVAALEADGRENEGVARTAEALEAARRRVLDDLVDHKLLLLAADKARVRVTDQEVESAMLRLRGDYPGDTFDKMLADQQRSPAALRQQVKEKMQVEHLFADEVFARIPITDEEVDAWLTEHAAELDRPEQVRALQIVVKTEAEARKLKGELRSGTDFAELARRYSLSPDAKVGGDLGFFARDQMPPPFGEVCFGLAPGQVSDVVGSPYGFHLFKVVERRAAVKPPEDQRRRLAERRLRKEKESSAQESYLAQLRTAAKIEVDEAGIKRLLEHP